jgi:hypothetical protein
MQLSFAALTSTQIDVHNISGVTQTVTVEFEGFGSAQPAAIATCPLAMAPCTAFTNVTCSGKVCQNVAATRAMAPNTHLRLAVNVNNASAWKSDSGLLLRIKIDEDRGAITAQVAHQFSYSTGAANDVQINMPFPVLVNGGRPF